MYNIHKRRHGFLSVCKIFCIGGFNFMNKIGLKLSLLAFVIFFAIAGGGCGGSGGGVQEGYNPDSDNDSGGGGGKRSVYRS